MACRKYFQGWRLSKLISKNGSLEVRENSNFSYSLLRSLFSWCLSFLWLLLLLKASFITCCLKFCGENFCFSRWNHSKLCFWKKFLFKFSKSVSVFFFKFHKMRTFGEKFKLLLKIGRKKSKWVAQNDQHLNEIENFSKITFPTTRNGFC